MTREEQERLASFLSMTLETFLKTYTVLIGRRRSLIGAGQCVFLDGVTNRCTVYDARPSQCRSFPFWERNLDSVEAWVETARQCEGIGRGNLIPVEALLERMQRVTF